MARIKIYQKLKLHVNDYVISLNKQKIARVEILQNLQGIYFLPSCGPNSLLKMIGYIFSLPIPALNHYLWQEIYTFLAPINSYKKILHKYSLVSHLFSPLPATLFIITNDLIIGGYLSLPSALSVLNYKREYLLLRLLRIAVVHVIFLISC